MSRRFDNTENLESKKNSLVKDHVTSAVINGLVLFNKRNKIGDVVLKAKKRKILAFFATFPLFTLIKMSVKSFPEPALHTVHFRCECVNTATTRL